MSPAAAEPQPRPLVVDRRLEVRATLGSLRAVGSWLRDAARDGRLPYEVAFGVDLAVHEAVENVVRYAWKGTVDHHVEIRFRCDADRVEVDVADDGDAFDPLSVPLPLSAQRIEDVIPGGQGVHLIRHFTDEVRYRREAGRNVLTLVRAWGPPGGEPVSGMSAEAWRVAAEAGELLRLEPGTVVLRPGEQNQALHFVLDGSVEVRLEEASGVLSRLPAGDCFGEMSVTDGQPASAWVVAAEACELLRVPAERVWGDLLPQPGFARALLRLLSERLRQTLERQTAWEAMRKELRLAREIQSSMIPPAGAIFLDQASVDCAALMDPAAEVGGDFYDAFFLDERRLFFAVGDVAGKGIGAALFMARSMTLLRAEALRRRTLHDVLWHVNEALARGNEQATFVSLFCAVFDCESGTLRYANGGSAAPFLRSGDHWSRLPMPRGIVVGALSPGVFESGRARLAPGDELVVFSDGVTEALSPDGELYGEERLRSLLESPRRPGALARVGQVHAAVRAFEAGRNPTDDLTLFVLGRAPGPVPEP